MVTTLLPPSGAGKESVARDVAARIAAHDAGRGAKYTRGRGPLRLLATRRCKTEGNALRLERAVKALSREQKRALVASADALGALARRVSRAQRAARR
jgi:putative endonuclease